MWRSAGSSTARPDGCGKPWAAAVMLAIAARKMVAGKPRRTCSSGASKWNRKSNAVPRLGHLCARIPTRAAVEMKAAFFVEPPRLAVFFQHPQRHLRESAPSKLGTHVIDQRATVAVPSQMGQDMQRRDVADARRV